MSLDKNDIGIVHASAAIKCDLKLARTKTESQIKLKSGELFLDSFFSNFRVLFIQRSYCINCYHLTFGGQNVMRGTYFIPTLSHFLSKCGFFRSMHGTTESIN